MVVRQFLLLKSPIFQLYYYILYNEFIPGWKNSSILIIDFH